jgi:hypothetical protein
MKPATKTEIYDMKRRYDAFKKGRIAAKTEGLEYVGTKKVIDKRWNLAPGVSIGEIAAWIVATIGIVLMLILTSGVA